MRECGMAINVVWIAYGVDYAVSLFLADNRWLWFRHNILLLLTLVLPIFRPLRLLRLIPMLHIFNRSAGAATRGRIALYASVAILMLIYVCALAEFSAERGAPDATITSFPLALWWALVTVTTVGYGDVYPVTAMGRIIAVGLMMTGIALIGIVSAMISSWIIDQVNRPRTSELIADAQSTDTTTTKHGTNTDTSTEQVTLVNPPDSDSSNAAELRFMHAEILRLADSVGQLNAELARTRRITKRHTRDVEHHGSIINQSTNHTPAEPHIDHPAAGTQMHTESVDHDKSSHNEQ